MVARRQLLAATTAVLLAGALGVAGLDATGHLPARPFAEPVATPTVALDPPRVPAADVLVPEPGSSAAAAPALDQRRLVAALRTPALGGAAAVVVDVASGALLLDSDAGTPRIPASVAKLATAAAVLRSAGPRHRLATRVVAGSAAGQVVLVGGGDASLTTRRPRAASLPQRASLAALADATAAALTAAAGGAARVTVAVDDSAFTGPSVSPAWRSSYVPSGVVSPVSALSVDAGRVAPGAATRSADPAMAAGADLVRLLGKRGVDVAPEVVRAVAPVGGRELARVESPPVAELVELALQTSDNDLAEALARVAALASGRPGSFEGAREAVGAALAGLGVPADGTELLDGSGLARGSRVAPLTLARLLQLAADGSHPVLAPLVEGLPVAAFSGTLSDRFVAGDPRAGAGLVRAKTGTLTGVSALAGVVSVAGRPAVVVAMSDSVPVGATLQARDDLDRFAALLAGGSAKNPGDAGD